jgi:hypothetical protein
MGTRVRTSIDGKPADWPAEVREEFDRLMAARPPANVTDANYFTPKPWVDEYNRGHKDRGFVYTIDGRHVCIIKVPV